MTDDQANKFRIKCTKMTRHELVNMLVDEVEKRTLAEDVISTTAELIKDIQANE
jgi:hypothetical protein